MTNKKGRGMVLSVVILAIASALAVAPSNGASEPDFSGCFPPEVKTVGIVMPGSVLAKSTFERGVKALERAGYRVKTAPRLSFAGRAPAEDRKRDLEDVWLDPEVDLVLCARGGSGTEDVVACLDWARLAARPNQRVLGFSNITILLNAMLARGVGHPYSGPSLGQMTRCSGDTLDWLGKSVGQKPLPATQLRALRAGAFSGLPCGGHIHYVSMGLKKGWMPDLKGHVLFLERNNSATYDDIAKELDAIAASGRLDELAGVVFGDVTPKRDSAKGSNAEDPAELKKAFAARVKCPVYDGFVYGHIPVSHAIDFKRTVRVSAAGVLTWN